VAVMGSPESFGSYQETETVKLIKLLRNPLKT